MMKLCSQCNGRFGLIRHRWLGYQFCTKGCLQHFLALRSRQIEQMKRWLGYIGST